MKFDSLDELLRTYYEHEIILPPSLHVHGDKVDKSIKEGLDLIETLATIGYYVALLSESSRFVLELFYGHNLNDSEVASSLNNTYKSKMFNLWKVRELRIKSEDELLRTFQKVGVIRQWRKRKNARD